MISENVVYLTIAEKSYPRKLAFSYLDELSKEFQTTYGAKVDTVRKPYAFVGFGEQQFSCANVDAELLQRHLHVQDRTIVPGYANGERGQCESRQTERRATRCDTDNDEKHGRAFMEG